MSEYEVALELDSKSTAKLMMMMCGSAMIEKGIRPRVSLIKFLAGNEEAAKELFDKTAFSQELIEVLFDSTTTERYDDENKLYFAGLECRRAIGIMRANLLFFRSFAAHVEISPSYSPQNYHPAVLLGTELDPDEARESFNILTEMFSSFSAAAEKVVLIRCDDMCVLSGHELEIFGKDLPAARFTSLRPGMTVAEAERTLMKKLILKRFNVRFRDAGVLLSFSEDALTLRSIRFEKPFELPVLGLDRNAVKRELGLPERYSTPNDFYSTGWFYENIIDNAVLRLDFEEQPSGKCCTVSIC